MKIKRIYIDGFGIFHDVDIKTFKDGIVVFYGLNESGKSTLVAFIKAILFGFERKKEFSLTHRYEPVNGGRHGGLIEIEDFDGSVYTVERYSNRNGKYDGDVTVRWDGKTGGEEVLGDILGNISKKFYSKVFAFDSQDIANLNSLNDVEVKSRIYSIGTGLPSDALLKAQKVLKAEKDNLYKPSGIKPEVNKILVQIRLMEDKKKQNIINLQTYEDVKNNLNKLEKKINECKEIFNDVNRSRLWLETILNDLKNEESKKINDYNTKNTNQKKESHKQNLIEKKKSSKLLILIFIALCLFSIFGYIFGVNTFAMITIMVCSLSCLIYIIINNTSLKTVEDIESADAKQKLENEKIIYKSENNDLDYKIKCTKSIAISSMESFFGEDETEKAIDVFKNDIEFIEHATEKMSSLEETYSKDITAISKNIGIYEEKLKEIERQDELCNNLDKDINSLKTELREKIKKFITLSLCEAMLNEAHTGFKRNRKPTVAMYASKMFNIATMQKYNQVIFPKDEDMKDIEVKDEHLRHYHATVLSKGTRDQLYLAMRFGLIYEYLERLESLPVIMDDVLNDCDDMRIETTIESIYGLSRKCQVFVFTCHSYVKDVFVKKNPYVQIFEIKNCEVLRQSKI